MKKIALTQGKTALVDNEDYEWLSQWKWHAHKDGNTFYVHRAGGRVNGSMTTIRMHAVILGKPPKDMITDHVDGNGLNNQRNNLRFVTTRGNAQNRSRVVKTSQYIGVFWRKDCKKWASKIYINGKNKHLGTFISEQIAYAAYCKAVEALGETVLETARCQADAYQQ